MDKVSSKLTDTRSLPSPVLQGYVTLGVFASVLGTEQIITNASEALYQEEVP